MFRGYFLLNLGFFLVNFGVFFHNFRSILGAFWRQFLGVILVLFWVDFLGDFANALGHFGGS